MRRHGGVGTIRDLDGMGLVQLLYHLDTEKGIDVRAFVTARRTVTPKQVGLLHVAREQVRMSDDDHSINLQSLGGVNTTVDLDQRGFDLMLAGMRCYGFVPQRPIGVVSVEAFGERPGFASPAQLNLIQELWAEWSGSAEGAGLMTWLERSYRVSAPRFLTAATASKAITALKAMKGRATARPKVTA